MQYTFGQLKRAVEHAIAGQPDGANTSSRFTSAQIVNRAISHLVHSHKWTWRMAFTDLTMTGNQSTIVLPTDFGELEALQRGTYAFESIRKLVAQEYITLKYATWDGKHLGYMLQSAPQTTNSAAPTMQLAIAPTPTSTFSNALTAAYLKVSPAMTDVTGNSQDNQVPDIPMKVHHILLALCRAYAVSTEDQQSGPEWDEANRLLKEGIEADLRSAGDFVQTIQGAGRSTYTFARLKSEVQAVLGPDAQRVNASAVVNDAVQYIALAYPWRWRQKTFNVTAPSVAPATTYWDQNLPSDFTQIQQVSGPGQVFVNDPDDQAALISNNSAVATTVSVQYSNAATPDLPPVAVARFYPVPTPGSGNVYTITYLNRPPPMVAETDIPAVPPEYHQLIACAARMYAERFKSTPTTVHAAACADSLREAVEHASTAFGPPGRLARVRPVRNDSSVLSQ